MAHAFYKPTRKQEKLVFDKLIYPVGLIAPIMTIPQVFDVWVRKSTQGASLSTWGAYTIVTFFWILYGLLHKEKPIILINSLLLILDFAIVYGILFNK